MWTKRWRKWWTKKFDWNERNSRSLEVSNEIIDLFRASSTSKCNFGLVHIGTCPLHLIHNSFKLAINSINWSIEQFLHNLVRWFNRSPSRREDYLQVAKSLASAVGKFISRFTITRWLETGPTLDRVIEQWANLRQYFLIFLPSKGKSSMNTFRYTQIKTMLEMQSTLIRLNFLVFLYHNIYEQMLIRFQKTQPLIHLLYEEYEQLIRRLFACFINDDLIRGKTLIEVIKIDFQLPLNQKADSSKVQRIEFVVVSSQRCLT